MKITLSNLSVAFEAHFCLNSINWEITADQHWAVVGTNGSGKSALAAVLTGAGDIIEGERIITTSEAGFFPRGLLVGTVEREGDLWRVALAMHESRGGFVRLIPSSRIPAPEDTQVNVGEPANGTPDSAAE